MSFYRTTECNKYFRNYPSTMCVKIGPPGESTYGHGSPSDDEENEEHMYEGNINVVTMQCDDDIDEDDICYETVGVLLKNTNKKDLSSFVTSDSNELEKQRAIEKKEIERLKQQKEGLKQKQMELEKEMRKKQMDLEKEIKLLEEAEQKAKENKEINRADADETTSSVEQTVDLSDFVNA